MYHLNFWPRLAVKGINYAETHVLINIGSMYTTRRSMPFVPEKLHCPFITTIFNLNVNYVRKLINKFTILTCTELYLSGMPGVK